MYKHYYWTRANKWSTLQISKAAFSHFYFGVIFSLVLAMSIVFSIDSWLRRSLWIICIFDPLENFQYPVSLELPLSVSKFCQWSFSLVLWLSQGLVECILELHRNLIGYRLWQCIHDVSQLFCILYLNKMVVLPHKMEVQHFDTLHMHIDTKVWQCR